MLCFSIYTQCLRISIKFTGVITAVLECSEFTDVVLAVLECLHTVLECSEFSDVVLAVLECLHTVLETVHSVQSCPSSVGVSTPSVGILHCVH